MKTSQFLPPVNCQYGAPMGRPSYCDAFVDDPVKLYLRRVYLDSGGYDIGGAYWGSGDPIYASADENDTVFITVRARNRTDAKRQVREFYPSARFFR